MVYRIAALYRDTRQAIATIEGRIANTRHAVGNGDARKAGATTEGRIADANKLAIFRKGYSFKAATPTKSIVANLYYA